MHSEQYKYFRNIRTASEDFLWEKEFMKMKLDWVKATKNEREIIKFVPPALLSR